MRSCNGYLLRFRNKDESDGIHPSGVRQINRNFGRSLRMCNEAAELLMTGAGQEFNGTRQLKLIQTCSLFRGIPIAVNRATRVENLNEKISRG